MLYTRGSVSAEEDGRKNSKTLMVSEWNEQANNNNKYTSFALLLRLLVFRCAVRLCVFVSPEEKRLLT